MTAPRIEPARVVIEALRLDRCSASEVERQADRATELGVGGVILFGGELEQVGRLTERLRREAGRPLWIGADLERGAGQQIRGLSELPPPAALARHPDPQTAVETAARVTASEALSVGINWVIAPVLDLDAEPDNPIVATRSFGADPDLVGRLGVGWIDACQATGAAACAKHFPGHGRTREDSHIGLPVVDASAEILEADLAPFARAADRVRTVMVAHVAYPALGSQRAATVSPEIVTELLRGRLGFAGPISTDAMIMGGIGEDDAGAAVEALRAGCDLICYPEDAAITISAIERAMDDPAFARRLADATARAERACPDASAATLPDFDAVGFARDTIVGDAATVLGWTSGASTRVVGVSDDPDVGPPAGRAGPLATVLGDDLRAAGWRIADGPDAEQCLVVLAATPRGWKGHGGPSEEVVTEARSEIASSSRGLIVLLGHARWLEALGVPAICAWSTETVNERAAAAWLDRAIAGEAAPGSADVVRPPAGGP